MRRRQFLASAASVAGAMTVARTAATAAPQSSDAHAIPHLLDGFVALPGTKGAQVDVDEAANPWRVKYHADDELFCGSCFKTFVLAQFLREVEAGNLDELEQLPLDDGVRSLVSPVFANLTGTTQARSALEAMIAHSDNTATDMAMKRVTPQMVREFIAGAGLTKVRIPDSTRSFFSYLIGAPKGDDLGWKAVKAEADSEKPDTSKYRSALNDVDTMAAPASQFVDYYKRALAGEFFKKPETLTEFKRIQAMADAIALVVPTNTAAYMKGGSIDWNGFHCLALAGQMIVRDVPVTTAFLLNWTDKDGDAKAITGAFKDAVADALGKVHKRLTEARA
ncbi:beta-lactamase [Hyphomicrobium sp. 1Nfss2.1]|uniref:serine hydrolase n=1 Tax=Hyphomicrobium sp. 1Nfss2.1 TaxID=3413936 RepID=UPI003C7AA3F4